MGVYRAVLDFFRPAHIEPPAGHGPLLKVVPGREKQVHDLEVARQANDRAAMGVVLTASQSMKTESGVQALLRGVLREADRDRDVHH